MEKKNQSFEMTSESLLLLWRAATGAATEVSVGKFVLH